MMRIKLYRASKVSKVALELVDSQDQRYVPSSLEKKWIHELLGERKWFTGTCNPI